VVKEAYVQGISTRSVDDLVQAMGMTGIFRTQVSRFCAEIDEKVQAFLNCPIEGEWTYLWLDATYLKMRQAGRIVSVAVTIAVGVNADGRREVLGTDISASEAERPSGSSSCASWPAAAFITTAFAQEDAAAAKAQWRKVADQLRPELPKPAAMMDQAEADVLAYMDFPAPHRTKLHSTNPLERLNGEVKDAPTWSASSPTTPPSPASSALS
jgi:putative transposase